MTEQLREIGQRLTALREIMEYSCQDMAARMDMDEAAYRAYESGAIDFSFSFLYNAATILGVDVLDILHGESPKLDTCCLVRKGEGFDIMRREAYDYKHLAFTFRNKKAEPFMVSVAPDNKGEKPVLHAHDGQEFDYVVSGCMKIHLGDMTYELREGDSIYYNSAVPHAMEAVGNEAAKFMAVVMK